MTPLGQKEFNIASGNLSSSFTQTIQHSYTGKVNRTHSFFVGTDFDGRKFINWPCGNDYNSGTTYYYADSQSPSYRRRGFEFTTTTGAHFYQGYSSGVINLYRRLPGESNHTYMNIPTNYYSFYYNTACEFNGNLFYFWQDNNGSYGKWMQIPTTAAQGGWNNGQTMSLSSLGGSTQTTSGGWNQPQAAFVHKNTVFLMANYYLWKYNPSSNNWTQITYSNWANSGNNVFQLFQDDTYLYVQSSTSASNSRWWRSNNLGVTWVQDMLGSYYGESYYANAINPQGYGGSRLKAFGWDLFANNYDSNWGYGFQYRRFSQVIVTFANNTQLSNINVGDFMRVSGETDVREYGYVTGVNASSNQLTLNMNNAPATGATMETLASTGSSSATKYLVISSTGNVTGYQGSDPGFVEISPGTNIDLTFPATFASGNAPDDEFAAGTVMQVTGKATNASASDTFNSNQVTPS